MALEFHLQPDRLRRKLKILDEGIWEGRAGQVAIEMWLANFDGDENDPNSERYHALYLLSRFMYFGETEIRQLLKALFRDLYRHPIANAARGVVGTTDPHAVAALVDAELQATRFLGLGNPAESGAHLLYYFRQENALPKHLFLDTHQLFDRRMDSRSARLRDVAVRNLVFIDDFCGSGETALDYSTTVLPSILATAARTGVKVTTSLYFLFGLEDALDEVRRTGQFDVVDAVVQLDATYKSMEPTSRYFKAADPLPDRSLARAFCEKYGLELMPFHPLGYKDGQLLIGFHHNVPDNTLPIIWSDDDPNWVSMFRRYEKLGS